jgi:hypothetical protein
MTFLRPWMIWMLVLGSGHPALGQSRHTEHTLKLDEGQSGAVATIEDMAWLAGFWTGEAFGGVVEETWNAPSAHTMVGLFKLVQDDQPSFYELQLLVEEDDSLVWKVKHFDPDFGAWEERADFASFSLVKLSERGAWFDGLTLLREGPDRLVLYLAMTHEGEVSEEKLVYQRSTP